MPVNSYAMPIIYAIGGILMALMFCLICQRRLHRRSRSGITIDELPPQRIIDDRRHCYHHDMLPSPYHHQPDHMSTRSFNQYQLEQPSPPSESDDDDEDEVEEIEDQGCDQETSSPDSV